MILKKKIESTLIIEKKKVRVHKYYIDKKT